MIVLITEGKSVIMDYQMPIKYGLEAGKEIMNYDNRANILILSANRYIKNMLLKGECFFQRNHLV